MENGSDFMGLMHLRGSHSQIGLSSLSLIFATTRKSEKVKGQDRYQRTIADVIPIDQLRWVRKRVSALNSKAGGCPGLYHVSGGWWLDVKFSSAGFKIGRDLDYATSKEACVEKSEKISFRAP